MKRFFYYSAVVSVIYLNYSCSIKKYSDNDFVISNEVRAIFTSFKISDTLIFCSNLAGCDSFVITKIDSSIIKNKQDFGRRPCKSLEVTYRQIPIDNNHFIFYDSDGDTTHTDAALFSFTRFPEVPESIEIYIQLSIKDFLFSSSSVSNFNQRNDITLGTREIKNCIKLENSLTKQSSKKSALRYLYFVINKGIVAYESYEGEIWYRDI